MTDPVKQSSLFFHRAIGEKIIIGEGESAVTIEVTRITEKNCTLTMRGPKTVKIDRSERRLELQA